MTNENIITTLNNLIETCKDGQEGFKDAAEGVEDSAMKNVFYRFSQQRVQFAGELQEVVRDLGGDPEKTSSIAGSIHRGWINIKSAITGQDEVAILNECIRGEEVALSGYKMALEQELPANIREIVSSQYKEIRKSYDHVTNMNVKRKTATA